MLLAARAGVSCSSGGRCPALPGAAARGLLAAAASALARPAATAASRWSARSAAGCRIRRCRRDAARLAQRCCSRPSGVAVVGYTDTVLTGRAFASRNGERLDADRELLALGAATSRPGCSRGFPVSSSGSRTALGDALGSRSQLYSLVTLLLVLLVLVVGGPLLAAFPSAALGALVIYAAHPADRRRRSSAGSPGSGAPSCCSRWPPRSRCCVLGVLNGVLVAVGLSILDLLRRVSRPHDGILGYVPGLAGMHDIDDYPDARRCPGWSSTATTRRCVSPTPRTSAAAPSPRPPSAAPARAGCAQRRGDRRARHHGGRRAATRCDELSRRGIVLAMARVKQDLRDRLARRAGRAHRRGPDLPDPADRRRRLPGMGRR